MRTFSQLVNPSQTIRDYYKNVKMQGNTDRVPEIIQLQIKTEFGTNVVDQMAKKFRAKA